MKRSSDQPQNLAAMDLNLLVVFDALWVERSVTAAGRRLGLSQPATSGSLSRLRDMLGDRLFVRGKRGLEPTDRCVELATPLRKTLIELRNVIAGSSFDPATTTRQLRIGAVDAAIAVLMPQVLARTMREAPHAQLQVIAIDPTRATEMLDAGVLDLAISPRATSSATVRSRPLYPLDFVVVVRPGHPLAKPKSDRSTLSTYPRVHVSFEGMPQVPAAVMLSSFLAVEPVLAHSDAWSVLPLPYAAPLVKEGRLAMFPMSKPHAGMQMKLLWPETQDVAPASRWLRDLISELSATFVTRR
jgi:DNA-binding transcriptional LysR family regulator